MTAALHVHRFGPTAPPQVLAIHGLTGHGRRWETLANEHLPEISVVAPDLLGHGRSSWDAPWTIDANVNALAGLLDAGAPALVVAHSFGGAVALNLAAAHPDLVTQLVLLDPAVGLDGHWMAEIADQMFSSPDYPDRTEARDEKVHGSWGEVPSDELERELDEHLVELPNGRMGWRLSVPAMLSYWSELARPIAWPSVPVTVVRATRTRPPYVSEELVTGLASRLGSDFALLDVDCDHMVPLALPTETAAVILDKLG